MATCSRFSALSDAERKMCSQTWAPLMREISSLVKTLHDLDNDKTKSTDIIAKHTERTANAIPSNPIYIWYPKPIHRLLSVKHLERVEMPLDVLELLVSSGFNINDCYGYDDNDSVDCSDDGDNDDFYDSDDVEDNDETYNDDVDDTDNNHNNGNDEYYLDRMTCLHIASNDNNYSTRKHGDGTNDINDDNGHSQSNDGVKDKDGNSNGTDSTDEDERSDSDGENDDDTDNYKLETMTCLHLAIMNCHWNAVRWLVQHGADCDKECCDEIYYISPIVMLARYQDAPLDLFALLKTPKNFNGRNKIPQSDLPLHAAVSKGHIGIVHHLIKLGASVNHIGAFKYRPLHLALKDDHTELALSLIEHGASVKHQIKSEYYCQPYLPIEFYIIDHHTQDELFLQLIPEDDVDILKAISALLEKEIDYSGVEKEHQREVSSMMQKLIQKLKCFEFLSMSIQLNRDYEHELPAALNCMVLNEHLIAKDYESLKAVYLCSVLLILLGCNVSVFDINIVPAVAEFARNVYHTSAIEDLWDVYNKNRGIKRLQTLCIQKTRQSMHKLTDESFETLPVPSSIRKLLMLHDVADVVFKAYQMWPKCMPIEDLM